MNESQINTRMVALISEAVAVLKEYEPQSGYLATSYVEDGDGASIHIYNDAFRKDGVKAVDIWVNDPEIKKQAVKNINLDELPELHTADEFFELFDECVLQIIQFSNSGEFPVLAAMLKQRIKEGMK